jgi:hypothetical protein
MWGGLAKGLISKEKIPAEPGGCDAPSGWRRACHMDVTLIHRKSLRRVCASMTAAEFLL